jgi:hypothetical protein
MDTEKLATSAVIDSISATDYLSAWINSGDKEPSWDGHIYVYRNKNKSKNNLIARVPVQVKGEQCDNISKNKTTYPIEMSDLKNYFNDIGVIFFVVLIKKDTAAKKIFYIDLLPVKLKRLLSDKDTQAVELKEFPVKNKQKQAIFQNFADNSKKQASFAKSDSFLPIEILRKPTDRIEKFTATLFETDDNEKKDPIQMLLKLEEIYVYANLKESNISQPLDSPIFVAQTQEKVPASISVKGVQFYSKFIRIRSKNNTVIQIGKSMTMELDTGKVKFKLVDNLRDIVIDLDFIIQIVLAKSCEINGEHIFGFEDFENFNIEEQQSLLDYHKKMVQVLDYLNIKDNIKISELTDMDRRNFATLITAFIDKKKVKGVQSESPLVFMKMLKFNLLLLFLEDKNNSNEVEIHDFFQMPDELVTIKEEDGKHSLTSQYIILKKDDYLHYSNTRFDAILTSFQKYYSADNSTTIDAANKVLLDLLSVYDESKEKKSEILCAAKDLAEWLFELNNVETFQLNLLQTIRREREFTKEEKDILLAIVLNNQNREDILFGANLLLDNQDVAEKYFERLDSAAQEQYKQYPIYKFKKK